MLRGWLTTTRRTYAQAAHARDVRVSRAPLPRARSCARARGARAAPCGCARAACAAIVMRARAQRFAAPRHLTANAHTAATNGATSLYATTVYAARAARWRYQNIFSEHNAHVTPAALLPLAAAPCLRRRGRFVRLSPALTGGAAPLVSRTAARAPGGIARAARLRAARRVALARAGGTICQTRCMPAYLRPSFLRGVLGDARRRRVNYLVAWHLVLLRTRASSLLNGGACLVPCRAPRRLLRVPRARTLRAMPFSSPRTRSALAARTRHLLRLAPARALRRTRAFSFTPRFARTLGDLTQCLPCRTCLRARRLSRPLPSSAAVVTRTRC